MKQALLAALALAMAGCQFIPHGHGSSITNSNGELTVNVGGEKIVGSGKVIEKSTKLEKNVTELIASSSLDVRVEEGDPSVTLTLDDNLHEVFPIALENGTLSLRPTQSFSTKSKPKVLIKTRGLVRLEAEGSTHVLIVSGLSKTFALTAEGASSAELTGEFERLDLNAQGASEITAKGSANEILGSGQGASSLNLFDLSAKSAEVNLEGASHADLNARRISGHASGASSLNYKGDAQVDVSTSGASSVDSKKL